MWLRGHDNMGGSTTFEAYAKANPQGHLQTASAASKGTYTHSINIDDTLVTAALLTSHTGGGMTYFWCYANFDNGNWKYCLVGWIYVDSPGAFPPAFVSSMSNSLATRISIQELSVLL
jgi:hypothetical protein